MSDAPSFDVQSDDGVDAFLASFDDDETKKARPSEDAEEAAEAKDETPEAPASDDKGEPEEASDDPDDQEVEIKVGEETKKATLRELKRLYGQEAALTQKSQKVAEATRVAEEQTARATASATAVLSRAQERFKPYADLDWLVLSQRMDTETFAQLRQDALSAKSDVDFLMQEVDTHMKEQQTRTSQAYQQAAQEAVKVLTDPKTGIEGFDRPLYEGMMSFAAENGVPEARTITSPGALKILHMAMQYAKGQKAGKAAEEKVKRAVETPKRVIKPGNGSGKPDGKREAFAQLRRSGEVDDAAGAFLSTF